METNSLATTDNNELKCTDIVKVSNILRTFLAYPEDASEVAAKFAEKFFPKGENALCDLISKISVQFTNDSLSQNGTRTETFKAQENDNHFARHNCREMLSREKDACCQGRKICTHLLDFIILLMAAVGNLTATVEEASRKSEKKSIPVDLTEEEESTENSFKSFSLRIWKRGIQSTSLVRDKRSNETPKSDKGNQDNYVIVSESADKENNGKNLNEKVAHKSEKHEMKFTEQESVHQEQSSDDENTHRHYTHKSKDNTNAGDKQRKTSKRKLPRLIDSFFKSAPVDVEAPETGEVKWLENVRNLQEEKEALTRENNALQSQVNGLFRENNDIKSFLRKQQTELESLSQEYSLLQIHLDEQKQSTRHQTFLLNSRLERLQNAKVVADQRCLNLSLKQERLVVYEEHVTMICLRVIKTVRRELEDTRALFDAWPRERCSSSMANMTWDEFQINGEGMTLLDVHSSLQKEVLELVERYRTIKQALATAKDQVTFENNYDEQLTLDNSSTTESDSSCYVVRHDCVCTHGNEGHQLFNVENECVRCERCNREISFMMGVKTNRRGQVYGDDTKAFLDDLVNDDFSDWHNFGNSSSENEKQQTSNVNRREPCVSSVTADDSSAKNVVMPANVSKQSTPVVPKSSTTVGKKLPKEEIAETKKATRHVQSPPRKWSRFPRRTPEPSPCLMKKTYDYPKQTEATEDNHPPLETDIQESSDQLWQIELEQETWEEEQERKFKEKQNKVAQYLKTLQLESKKERWNTDKQSRRSSVSSEDSTTTSCSSSFSLSDHNTDLKYNSACTVEELVDHKMRDVENKFNSSICDAWVDDVELALLLIKKKSKQADAKKREVKNLFDDILEQKRVNYEKKTRLISSECVNAFSKNSK
ncbi:hypothetical protein AWC38_SpisGene15799 [Stylophora pistillata]|uniref:Uncharacterized protein n=1 Tax=Stylophora pistillata TaxID=50429 RepID=A0A2B4RU41_STYPI|nr:hypothetical protein AWC38_SpisGene15799 [Stylophora pistillata]